MSEYEDFLERVSRGKAVQTVFKEIDLDKIINESHYPKKAFMSERERRMRQFGLTPKTRTKKRKKRK